MQVIGDQLREVHMVWGAQSFEAKRQVMRDMHKFVDPPEYYSTPYLVSMDMRQDLKVGVLWVCCGLQAHAMCEVSAGEGCLGLCREL